MADESGIQSSLEVAAVEYVQNANQETLASLRRAALDYAESKRDVLNAVELASLAADLPPVKKRVRKTPKKKT